MKYTLECVAILLEEKPDWDSIKKMITDANFLSRMKGINAAAISKST